MRFHTSLLTLVGNGSRNCLGMYRCECGVVKEIRRRAVDIGHTKSCGCSTRKLKTKHGMCSTPEYHTWYAMVVRCRDGSDESYGGRGVFVCARWKDKESGFLCFYADMGPRPPKTGKLIREFSIDRIDNDSGYWCGKSECVECGPANREPNCRWATPTQQARNRRNTRIYIHNGRTMCMSEWAAFFGVTVQALSGMINRNGVQEAFRRYSEKRSTHNTHAES